MDGITIETDYKMTINKNNGEKKGESGEKQQRTLGREARKTEADKREVVFTDVVTERQAVR